jgi:hypothetical protein
MLPRYLVSMLACAADAVGSPMLPRYLVSKLACAADAVGVVLDVLRAVEVDHVLHTADVDAAA